MLFTSVFAALATSAVVAAQTAQVVQVGGPSTGPTIYTPNTITAGNGTVVSFQFTGIPGNHTVTQSSFANPCEPLANGFDSGWVFINDTSATTPVWNLTITDDSKPIWFYCKQIHPAVHCNLGMVGVINVKPGANSLDAFKSAAASASVGEGQNGFSGVGAAATGVPVLGSGATLVGPSATAPAGPGASSPGGGSGTSSSSAPGASKTGSALSTGVSSLTVFFTTLFGMTLVL